MLTHTDFLKPIWAEGSDIRFRLITQHDLRDDQSGCGCLAWLPTGIAQVFARLRRLVAGIEEANEDLGAGPVETFLRVVLPNLTNAMVGSVLLVLILSFDEIAITFLLTETEITSPMYIWARLRRGVTPELCAIATLMIVASTVRLEAFKIQRGVAASEPRLIWLLPLVRCDLACSIVRGFAVALSTLAAWPVRGTACGRSAICGMYLLRRTVSCRLSYGSNFSLQLGPDRLARTSAQQRGRLDHGLAPPYHIGPPSPENFGAVQLL